MRREAEEETGYRVRDVRKVREAATALGLIRARAAVGDRVARVTVISSLHRLGFGRLRDRRCSEFS